MPYEALVWVDRQELHTLVYVDESLASRGKLSRDGLSSIDRALLSVGAPTLKSSRTCARPPVRVAG
ncbi:MAG: hypothetical protein ACRDQ0_00200 [Pseudonocardia sp.]